MDLGNVNVLLQKLAKTKPSYPNPTDTKVPVDENLWRLVLEVASGKRLEFRRGERIIHAPNGSRGYRNMPNNPKGIAWAVKQYNGFEGHWKERTEEKMALTRLAAGGVEATQGEETLEAQKLASEGLIKLASTHGPWSYWDITAKGMRIALAEQHTAEAKITGSHAVYYNRARISGLSFQRYANHLDQLLTGLNGWHKKALLGALTVVLNDQPTQYRASRDELWVQATPQLLTAKGYGSPDYSIVRELGHRYEQYNEIPKDFDSTWRTSRYSYTEGKVFAELFAISHFNLTGSWDSEKVRRFEAAMEAVAPQENSSTLTWVD